MTIDFTLYIFALLVGILLGLIGGIASLLTIPIFVYVGGFSVALSTTYSLFVIGITSAIRLLVYRTNVWKNIQTNAIFILPILLSTIVTRNVIYPHIPTIIFSYNHFVFTKNMLLMILFLALLLVAAISIITSNREMNKENEYFSQAKLKIKGVGIVTGFLTSLLGVGGGFIMIPTLVFLQKMSMKTAVITSLAIISINSLLAFGSDIVADTKIDWNILATFCLTTIFGVFIGIYLSNRISSTRIRIVFGYFLVCLGFIIFIKELIVLLMR
jgi:uncharacterized membrane protein YfcA